MSYCQVLPNGHLSGVLHFVRVAFLVADAPGQAKIGNLADFIFIYEDVSRCQVAVNNLHVRETCKRMKEEQRCFKEPTP